METPFGKDDCSSPRCKRDSKELVKFNERDLKSSVSGQRAKQEHEEDSQSPSALPPLPQLDAYFNEVEASFEEWESLPDNEEENDTEVHSHEEDGMKQVLPSSAVLHQSKQPQPAKKDEKVTMDDLQGFIDRNVVAKDKPRGENGIAEVEKNMIWMREKLGMDEPPLLGIPDQGAAAGQL